MGTLYLVATPIGNLADLTYRAVEVLRQVALIACEDTRVSRTLLTHYQIRTTCISYHTHNEAQAAEKLIALLMSGKDIALISDAGTPLISDPGALLVTRAAAAGITITAIPGACAAISALSVAALGDGSAYFAGFLPASGKERDAALRKLRAVPATLIIYESPHRIARTLADLLSTLGDRTALLARELTKRHETLYRDTLSALGAICEQQALKGEMVLVIAPAPAETISDETLIHTMLREALSRLPASKAAAEVASATGASKRDLYALALEIKDGQKS